MSIGDLLTHDSPAPADSVPTPAPAAPTITAPKRKVGRPKGSRTRSGSQRPKPSVAGAASEAFSSSAAPKAGRPTTTAKELDAMRTGLRNVYTGTGAMLAMFGLVTGNAKAAAVGNALRTQAADCANALTAWAESNPAIMRALQAMTSAGGATLVIAAHVPIVTAAFGHSELPTPDADTDGDLLANGGDIMSVLAGLAGGFGVGSGFDGGV